MSTWEYSQINPCWSCFSHNIVLHFFVPRYTKLRLAIEMDPALNFYTCLFFHLKHISSVICHSANFTSLNDLLTSMSTTMLKVVLDMQLQNWNMQLQNFIFSFSILGSWLASYNSTSKIVFFFSVPKIIFRLI